MWVCHPLVTMEPELCIRTPVSEVCLDWVIVWAGPLGSAVTYSEGALDTATTLKVLTDSCMHIVTVNVCECAWTAAPRLVLELGHSQYAPTIDVHTVCTVLHVAVEAGSQCDATYAMQGVKAPVYVGIDLHFCISYIHRLHFIMNSA